MSNRAGQATAFMAITPITGGEESALQEYLRGLPQGDSPLSRLTGTHFARWVILAIGSTTPRSRTTIISAAPT